MANRHKHISWLIIASLFILTQTIRADRCKSASSFYFDRKRPRQRSLPFCKEYSRNTCCHPLDAQQIFQSIKPLLQNENVSNKCKQLTKDMFCSSCNPDIGTHHLNGICIDYCDKWYSHCENEYYYLDIYGQLKICEDDSRVCSPLNTFIKHGEDFCEASGFDTNHISINCFDGHVITKNKRIRNKHYTNKRKRLNKKFIDNASNEPSASPTISPSDNVIEPHPAPSLQNLNL